MYDPIYKEKRTPYCLRNYYITEMRRKGVGYETLAKQCGTSVAMLKKYYDKVQPEDEAAVLVNDPIDALALIDIGTDPDPRAAKTDLTLGRDGLVAIRP